jgi:hypothetical protein
MGRHYSTRDFFRQMPNWLLARYFAARGVLAQVDFAALKEAKSQPLFAAWLELPEGQRNAMDAELRETLFTDARPLERRFTRVRPSA